MVIKFYEWAQRQVQEASDETIEIPDSALRGVSFLPSGQRMESWVPGGTYTIGDEAEISVGRGSDEKAPAIALHDVNRSDATWYVGEKMLKQLQKDQSERLF